MANTIIPYEFAFEIFPHIWIIRNEDLANVWDEYWDAWWNMQNFKIGIYLRQKNIPTFWKEKTKEKVHEHLFDWMFIPLPTMNKFNTENLKEWLYCFEKYTYFFLSILEFNSKSLDTTNIFVMCDNTLERSIFFFCGMFLQLGIINHESIQLEVKDYFPNEKDYSIFMDLYHQYQPILTRLKKIKLEKIQFDD